MPFRRRDNYSALDEESTPLGLGCMLEDLDTSPAVINVEQQHDDTTVVNPNIIHKVPKNKEGWTHIKDLDSFFARMYRYYIRGGFYPMFMSDLFYLIQFIFIIWFSTFLVYCVKYPTLFRNEPNSTRVEKLTLNDVIYPTSQCIERITWKWWSLIVLAAIIWAMRLILSVYHLYYAFDTKLFYNNALKINDSDLVWISWATIQERVREAQSEHNMCVQKLDVTDLDIYHRILRFDNYLVAMVNKNLLPLQIHVPLLGDFHYLSRGLKWNLEFLLFSSPWSPWENFWQLRRSYKDNMKRMVLAKNIERQLLLMAIVNILMAPIILTWQILYFFFQYAELVRRSPASLGLRTWSVYARVTLRHFNELEHELWDRLNRAYKPATKYLNSFSSPVTTVIAKNVVFLSASVLGVLVVLTVYDEDVITVEHVLTIITFLGCVLAAARGLIAEEERLGGSCTGPARGEELFVQVLGHVHYLPAEWRTHAHTKDVAAHFQQLFQFRAVYILFELLSPVLCPLMLLRLRARSVDIVDFYRNFTVNVTGIGDVCSFAKLDIRRHGNPEWRTPGRCGQKQKIDGAQCEQGEGGKTELSLVAFSCRHPGWQPADPAQRLFLRSLRQSIEHALPVNSGLMNKTMMGSYIQQSVYSANTPLPAVFSYYQHARPTHRLPDMDETSEEEDDEPMAGPANAQSSHSGQSGHMLDQSDHMLGRSDPLLGRSDHMLGRSDHMLGRSDPMLGRSGSALRHGSPTQEHSALRSELAGVSSSLCSSALGLEPAVAPPANDTLDMTVSALHLYDLHLSQRESRLPSCCENNCTERGERARRATSEHTPLLPRP